ncbi:MAG: DUF5916 domain-containing protein [Bacteroidota bacterium]
MKRSFFIFFCVLFPALSAPILPNDSYLQLQAVRSEEPVSIDGKLSERIWQRAGFTNFHQQEPAQGETPSQKSEVWLAYDDEAIYFAARYYDLNPDSIMARLVRRDYIWGDPSDGCVLYLDSYRDKRNGYFFYVSAAGGIADGLIENDSKQPNDLTWDAVWEGTSKIDSSGWIVEMKIPYSQLRFKEGSTQVWGVNVERFISRSAETDMIVYTPRNESGFASRFPDLVGMEGVSPRSRFEVMPYITGKAEFIHSEANDPFNSGKKYSPGLGVDLRAGLGSSLTLNATINPDFGQVEVDPAVVNLSDVESTFDEKRPFFTEGVNIFRFGNGGATSTNSFSWNRPSIFYSRRIGRAPQGSLPDYDFADVPTGTHILGAAKISGQLANTWKVGTIHALTQRENARIQFSGIKSDAEVEPLTYYAVIRAQRDFNTGRQGIGFLSTFTNRFFKDPSLENTLSKNAAVAAFDGWTFLDRSRTYVITGWAALSRVSGDTKRMIALQRSSGHYFQRPDASHIEVDSSAVSMTGFAGRFVLNKNRGNIVLNASAGFISPEFEINDLGYNPYSDMINAHIQTGYRWNTPASFYQNAGVNFAVFSNYDFGWNKTAHGYYAAGFFMLPSLYGADFSFTYNPESYNARRTRGGPLTLNPSSRHYYADVYTDNRLWWVLTLSGSTDMGEDARSYSVNANFEFKITPTLTLQAGPAFSRNLVTAQWITAYNDITAENTFGRRYVFAHLDQKILSADLRVNWIINPRLSFQMYMQPLIASGNFDDFKELRHSRSFDFRKYGTEGSGLQKIVSDNNDIYYKLDSDGNGPSPAKTISSPDFNSISLRGSAVLRWEYRAGSALYLVWTQSRLQDEPAGDFRPGHSMGTMFDINPDNIFMLKITYWV